MLLLLVLLAVPAAHGARQGGQPVALVTAETQNQLIAVGLPSGKILRRLPMPADPQNVEAGPRTAVVVSSRGAAVTLVDVRLVRTLSVPHGSFNASRRAGLVATASLLRGTLAERTAAPPWRRLKTTTVAPAARDVALALLP